MFQGAALEIMRQMQERKMADQQGQQQPQTDAFTQPMRQYRSYGELLDSIRQGTYMPSTYGQQPAQPQVPQAAPQQMDPNMARYMDLIRAIGMFK